MSYSENQLKKLAQTNPKELARILTSPNKDIHMLSFGIEILCDEVEDEGITIPVIRQLLKHVNAIVREGAILGAFSVFSSRKPPQDILERLELMFHTDPSPAIKNCAKDILAVLANF